MTTKDDFVGCDVGGGRVRGGPFGDGNWYNVNQAYGWVNSDHTVGPNGYAFHTGLDIGAPLGTPLVAMADGVVTYAVAQTYQEGNLIILNHGDVEIQYYHMRDAALVKTGDKVVAGQVVGYVGSTGNSNGPHLHLGVYVPPRSGQTIDPAWWLADLNDYGYMPVRTPIVTEDANHSDNYDVGLERIRLEDMLRLLRDEHARAKGDPQVLIDIINRVR